jgi:hypothetical protein
MSMRFLTLVLLLAAAVTAVTYVYTTETKHTLSDPGLADLERRATVHGWPWGYYAEVTELTRLDERSVAVFEYKDLRWQMLGQTCLAWLVVSLVLVSVLIIVADPRRRLG